MLIRSATITLAGTAITGEKGITGLSINGQCAVDTRQMVSAAGAKAFGKGNLLMSVSFTAVREFATDTALEQFAVSHIGAVVKSGALVVTVGSQSYTATHAAVQSISIGEPVGLLLPVTYSIACSPLL